MLRRRTLDFRDSGRGAFCRPGRSTVTALKRKDQRARLRSARTRSNPLNPHRQRQGLRLFFAKAAEKIGDVSKLPFSLKVLLENMLRFEDGGFLSRPTIRRRSPTGRRTPRPARKSSTGGARATTGFHRRALRGRSGRHARCNQQARRRRPSQSAGARQPRHRPPVMVDEFGHPKAVEKNVELEYARNAER